MLKKLLRGSSDDVNKTGTSFNWNGNWITRELHIPSNGFSKQSRAYSFEGAIV